LSIKGAKNVVFSEKVQIAFNVTLPNDVNISTLCLAYVNESTRAWVCESSVFVTQTGLLAGYTSHFTDFAVLLGDVNQPKPTAIQPDTVLLLKTVDQNEVAIYVISGIFFLYLIGVITAWQIDKRQNAVYYSQSDKSEDLSEASISLDKIDVTVEGENQSDDDGKEGKRKSLPPPLPPPMPPVNSPNTERKLMHRRSYTEKVGFLMAHRLREKHSWLAVVFRSKATTLTRVDRLTLLLVMVMSNMVASAAFYESREDSGLAERLIIGLIVGSIVFPLTLLTTLMFKKANDKYKRFCYVITTLYCLVCGTVTILYSLQFGQEKAKGWLVAIGTSTLQDGIVNQPIKLLVSAAIVACCPFSWLAKII